VFAGTGQVVYLHASLPEVKTRAEYSESETYEGLSRVREVLSSCSGHRLVPLDEVRSWFLSSHQGDVAQTDRVVPAQPNSQLSNQKSPDRLGVERRGIRHDSRSRVALTRIIDRPIPPSHGVIPVTVPVEGHCLYLNLREFSEL